MRLTAALVFSFAMPVALAAEGDADRFRKAYDQYTALMVQGHEEEAVPFARSAMELGTRIYGKNSENAAKLTLNYGRLLLDTNDIRGARHVLRRALNRYEGVYGRTSIELVDPLLQLGHADVRPQTLEQQTTEYNRAIRIASTQGADGELLGHLNFEAGSRLILVGGSDEGARYLRAAIDHYTQTLGPNHRRTALATFWLARFEMARGRHRAAAALLEVALPGLDSDRLQMSARTLSVRAYEELGEVTAATPHCVAISRMRPWDGSTQPEPIFRREPVYPTIEFRSRQEGSAVLQFSIDEAGRVVNPTLVETTGSDAFGQPALNAVHDWRFAPRLVDGKPQATQTVRYDVRYEIPVAE